MERHVQRGSSGGCGGGHAADTHVVKGQHGWIAWRAIKPAHFGHAREEQAGLVNNVYFGVTTARAEESKNCTARRCTIGGRHGNPEVSEYFGEGTERKVHGSGRDGGRFQ